MSTGGRVRGGNFQRNQAAQRRLREADRLGDDSARDLLSEYERQEWAQNQAGDLAESLQSDQITPYWLEPLGDSGIYVTPNEPVDPWDCDRYPDSPWCGGSGVDPLDLAQANPAGAGITFTANSDGTEYCLQIDMSLFAIGLPPFHACYRTPDARPLERPPLPRPPRPDFYHIPPAFTPVDFGADPGCLYWPRIKKQNADFSGPNGELEYNESETVNTSIVTYGGISGYYTYASEYAVNGDYVGLNWFLIWFFYHPQQGWTRAGSQFNFYSNEYYQAPLFPPQLTGLVHTGQCVEPPDLPTMQIPPPLPGDPMACCNTDAIEEMLRILMKRLGTDQYPATVPKSLVDTAEDTESLESLTELIGWKIRQIDALFGQFPIEIEIKDADPSQEGDQARKVSLPNLAEAVAEMYALSLRSAVGSDIHTSFLMRLAAEVIATKNAALVTQDYAKANASYLGYKGNTVKRKVNYAFNATKLDRLESILSESSKTIIGWQDDDKNTVQAYLEKLMFAASIIKLTHFKSNRQADGLLKELAGLLGVAPTPTPTDPNQPDPTEDEWRAFLQELNNAEGGFNRNSPVKPEVIDPTVSGEDTVDTTFTAFDLIPDHTDEGNNARS